MSDFIARLKESRTLWSLVMGLFILFIRNIFPEFPITDEAIMAALVSIGAYVVAENFEGLRPNMDGFKTFLASRKAKALVVSLSVVFLKAYKPDLAITEDQVVWLVGALGTLILGWGVEGSALSGSMWVELDEAEYEESLG